MLVPCSKCGLPYEVSIEQLQSAPSGVVVTFAHDVCPDKVPTVYTVQMVVTSVKGDDDANVLADVKASVSGSTLIEVLDELSDALAERWDQFRSMAGFAELEYPTNEGDST